MQRYGFERGLLVEDSEHGQWVRYSDLAAARAEIERLTHLLDLSKKTTEAVLERAENAEIERDEARAQVAAAFNVAAENCARKAKDCDQLGFASYRDAYLAAKSGCKALTPADAKSALDAYGREKVREGAVDAWNAAALILESGIPADVAARQMRESATILAEMETLK